MDLDLDVLDRHRIVGDIILLVHVLDRLGVDEREHLAEAKNVQQTLDAWLDTFAGGRPYKMSAVGLEADLERWLVSNLHVLAERGYAR